jgi:ribose transport system substrate-binding protein
MVGQELTGDEAKGISPLQFLKQEDITFDPSKGWTGYPDFAQRFAKLWGVGG